MNFLSHLIILGEKIHKKPFFSICSLMWPSKFFFGLFHFFRDILWLRSRQECSNSISKFNIIPKGKWFKFLISNHSVQTQLDHLKLNLDPMVSTSKNLDFSKIFFTNRILPNQAKSWKWVMFKKEAYYNHILSCQFLLATAIDDSSF